MSKWNLVSFKTGYQMSQFSSYIIFQDVIFMLRFPVQTAVPSHCDAKSSQKSALLWLRKLHIMILKFNRLDRNEVPRDPNILNQVQTTW